MRDFKISLLVLLFSLAAFAQGCASKSEPLGVAEAPDLLKANNLAGDALAQMLDKTCGPGNAILTTSLVDLDNLNSTSSLGRLSGQQIGSRLGQRGFKVLEARMTAELVMNERGEFMLSRDTAALFSRDPEAHAALVGVYSQGAGRVYMSARVVRLADNAILGAYEYYLPYRDDAHKMLRREDSGSTEGNAAIWRRFAARRQAYTGEPPKTPVKPLAVAIPAQPATADYMPAPQSPPAEYTPLSGGKFIEK